MKIVKELGINMDTIKDKNNEIIEVYENKSIEDWIKFSGELLHMNLECIYILS